MSSKINKAFKEHLKLENFTSGTDCLVPEIQIPMYYEIWFGVYCAHTLHEYDLVFLHFSSKDIPALISMIFLHLSTRSPALINNAKPWHGPSQ